MGQQQPFKSTVIKPVISKGNQPWISIGRTDAEAELPILWPPDVKNILIGKDPNARKDWRQEEKGMTEDEMIVWHHRLDGHEFEQAPEVGDGHGGLACCSSWGRKESDTTERLNWLTDWAINTHTHAIPWNGHYTDDPTIVQGLAVIFAKLNLILLVYLEFCFLRTASSYQAHKDWCRKSEFP